MNGVRPAARSSPPVSQAFWVEDVLQRKADEGRIFRVAILQALAKDMKVNATGPAGLFAAGKLVGNLQGDQYIGGGGAFGSCIVFGKLAGKNAARQALSLND